MNLELLRAQLRSQLDARAAALGDLEAVTTAAEAEARDLNSTEAEQFRTAKAKLDQLDSDIKSVQERIADIEDVEARTRAAAETAARLGEKPATVTAEPRTYTPEAERRDGVSFFRDVMMMRDNPVASERIARSQREAEVEARAASDSSNFVGLVVPQYLTDMVAPYRRAGRPLADIANKHDLPPTGTTVNISRITTGTSTAIQATEGTAFSTASIDDTLLTVNVRTIGGYVDLSRQAVDRGVGTDAITIADLVRSYNTTLDNQLINGDGTSGTMLGVVNTGSIVSVSYTDASPTVAEAYPTLFNLIQQVQTSYFGGISHFVMHPRRWWWFMNAVGTSFPFIQQNNSLPWMGGSGNGTGTYENGVAGIIAGVPVILDANIATNTGAGTNQDAILGVTASELHLWEDPAAPMYIRAEEVVAHQGQIRFVLFGYAAFTAGRYPGAHGTITGTGLVTPTYTGA